LIVRSLKPSWILSGDIDVLCIEPQMWKITIRYVLAATAVMAVCLAVHQIPLPPPVVAVNGEPISEPSPARLHHILTW